MSTVTTRCDHEIPAGWEPSPPRPGTPLTPQLPEPKKAEPCCADDPLKVPAKVDLVNNPPHYATLFPQPIAVIEAWSLGHHEASALAYIARARFKENERQDLQKAVWYLKRRIAQLG